MSTRRRLQPRGEKSMGLNSIARFFHNVRNVLAGQPPLDDHFDQGRHKSQGAIEEHAARSAFGTDADVAANKVYVPKPKPEPWQMAERA